MAYSKELKAGIKVEMEHARLFPKNLQKAMALRIAKDHIKTHPKYYTNKKYGIIAIERKLKKRK